MKCHFCQGDTCFENDQKEFCWSRTGKCYISVDLTNEEITHQRGCVDNELFCVTEHFTNNIDAYLQCCSTNLCNDKKFVFLRHQEQELFEELNLLKIVIFISIFIASFAFIVCIAYILSKTYTKKSNYSDDLDLVEKAHLKGHGKAEDIKKTKDNFQDEATSGSGSGNTQLNPRTFAKQINLITCVGKGRYGEVWKGIFHYEEVAVKIFLSRDEASYKREIEIYSDSLCKHENILTFIGSDLTSKNSCTQFWLVTAYHELGSLFDYLYYHTINLQDMFSIMTSIASGINYLHNESLGTQKKSAIAHRDIKSKNILMKTKNICCIADFGLAVTKQKEGLNIGTNNRVGTKRYMAPEVLDNTFNDRNFDSYTMADIYSFSLVLWEIIRRLKTETQPALNYEVPYQNKVPSDPSFEDMRKVVCSELYRPELPVELEKHNFNLNPICQIIQECWSKNPSSRLTALRIKKSLNNLNTFGKNIS